MIREKMPNLTVTAVIAAVIIGIFAFQSLRGEVGRAVPTTKVTEINSVPLSVKSFNGKAKANLRKTFNSEDEIDRYVSDRKAKLEDMALDDPKREIEVVISSENTLSLGAMKEKATEAGLVISEMGLDFYVNGEWSRMAQFDASSSVIDPAWSAEEIAEKFHQIEGSTQAGNTKRSRQEAAFTSIGMRFARGRISADRARDMQADPEIMLVDPLTDIEDQLRSEYGEVKIGDVVQLFVLREMQFGQRYRRSGPFKH
jgi:hypothetical protein